MAIQDRITISHKKDDTYSYNYLNKSKHNSKPPTKFLTYIKNLINGKYSEQPNARTSSLHFDCYKIESLKELLKAKKNKLSYRHAFLLYIHIGYQIKNLLENNIGILELNIEDISIVHTDEKRYNSYFIINTAEYFYNTVTDKDKNKCLEIYTPYNKSNPFISPELLLNDKIPFYPSPNTIFFSLALLIAFCLCPFEKSEHLHNTELFKKHIESIAETKLYWALLRCIKETPSDRHYLFI